MIVDLDRFLTLFWGHPDVVGSDHGRGLEMPGPLPIVGHDSWRSALAHHLDGTHGIGVYPMYRNSVRWGCVDFDQGDIESWEHAWNVARLLDVMVDVAAWIERSRSKGYHLWVFAPLPVPAVLMRHALVATCQMTNAPALEVNPKSDTLEADQLGNFVRLPYKGWVQHQYLERQVIVDLHNKPVALPKFLEACEQDATLDRLERLAVEYRDPNPPPVQPFERPKLNMDDSTFTDGGVSGLANIMLRNGPKDGQDRSSWLYALAMALGEGGMDYDEIKDLLRQADEAHGQKYTRRRDGERRYHDLAIKAINKEMS